MTSCEGEDVGARHGRRASCFDARFDVVDDLVAAERVEVGRRILLAQGGGCVIQKHRRIAALRNQRTRDQQQEAVMAMKSKAEREGDRGCRLTYGDEAVVEEEAEHGGPHSGILIDGLFRGRSHNSLESWAGALVEVGQ